MSCPDCFKGAVHEGKPTGTVTKLHGLDTYVAEPANGQPPKGIVVIIPDAFGWDFVNIRLMADHMAKKRDYRVYAPDFMRGHSAAQWMIGSIKAAYQHSTWAESLARPYHFAWLIFGMIGFIIPNRFGRTFPVVKEWLESLRRNEAAHLPVGVAGYCWGGKHVVLLAEGYQVDGKPLMDAGFTGHPSMLSFYGEIEKMTIPVSFAVGETDAQMPLDKAEGIRKIIEAKPDGQKGELKIYWGYNHGFACRIDPSNDDPTAADEAEDQALAWFEQHFAKTSY